MSQTRSILLVAALIVAGGAVAASRIIHAPAEEPQVPAAVGDERDSELETRHGAVAAFTWVQPDGAYRALVFKLPRASAADSDYRVVVYRREGNGYRRHGAEINLVDFERPWLSRGTPPRVETTQNRLGVRFHVAVDASGADLVPSEGVTDGGALVGHPPTR